MELVKGLVFTYDVLSFPFYFVTQRPWIAKRKFKRKRAAQVNPSDPYSALMRVGRPSNGLVDQCKTIDELLRTSVAAFKGRRCLGTRPVLMVEEFKKDGLDGKVILKKTLGDHFEWLTYDQVDKRIDDLSRGLLMSGVKTGDRVAIFLETRMEWMLAAQALFRVGATLVTLYATLGDEGVSEVIKEVECSHLVTSFELLDKLRPMAKDLPSLRHIVYVDTRAGKSAKDAPKQAMFEFPENVQLQSFDELEASGTRAPPDMKGKRPSPEDVALIMYTSGSTGRPKGVVISHRSVVSSIRAYYALFAVMDIDKDDPFVSYLPLAHVMEFIVEHIVISMGVALGYSSPLTLTSASPGVAEGCPGDANVLRPATMVGVPLILDRIRKGINEKVEGRSKSAKKIFNFAMDYKNYWTQKGYRTPIVNRLICKKVKAGLGGRVKYMFCGGAALSPDTLVFARNCMDIILMQGFGATETMAVGMIMEPDDITSGRCGTPLFGAKVRLVDWEEGGYRATDKPRPRGELVVGGEFVAQGYFKRDAETKEAFKEEKGTRWFYTGDIAEFWPDGTVQIIDRKKDLVKLSFGEYISLGKIEAELKSSSYVDNLCIMADETSNFTIALVSPNRTAVSQLARHLGIEGMTFEQMCTDPEVQAEVLKSLNEHGAMSKLTRAELPRKIRLCREEWTPDNGLVTAALKIRRKQIRDFYQTDINKMFGISNSSTDQNKNSMMVATPLAKMNGTSKLVPKEPEMKLPEGEQLAGDTNQTTIKADISPIPSPISEEAPEAIKSVDSKELSAYPIKEKSSPKQNGDYVEMDSSNARRKKSSSASSSSSSSSSDDESNEKEQKSSL